MADTSVKLGRGRGVASHRPPRGLPHGAPGASLTSSAGGGSGCCPRGTVWSGCARPTGCHLGRACKTMTAVERLVEKHLIQNQMFGSWQTTGQSPRPTRLPIYISWYINDYGQPWTSSDAYPTIRLVHGQIAGSGGVLLTTTDHMVDQLWGPAPTAVESDRIQSCNSPSLLSRSYFSSVSASNLAK
jgi:hypothetical protein